MAGAVARGIIAIVANVATAGGITITNTTHAGAARLIWAGLRAGLIVTTTGSGVA